MNFLQLVQRTKTEAGLQGAAPVSVASTVGDTAKLAGWVADAWRAIQLESHRNWRWLRATGQGSILAGDMSYTIDELLGAAPGATRFDRFRNNEGAHYRPRAWSASTPETTWALRQLDHDDFVARFLVGVHAPAAPQFWSIAPSGEMLVGPTPDAAYSLRFDYVKSPQELTLDTDVPEMPSQYHMMIVWMALWSFAGYDAAPEVAARAQAQYDELELGLVTSQGESWRVASVPLA